MNKKNLKKYQLKSPYRKRELLLVCRQYPEWISELDSMADLKAVTNDGLPHSSSVGDPTGNAVTKREKLHNKVLIVERTAREAGGDIADVLLLAMTKGYSFADLKQKNILFLEKDMYYERRAKFLFLLDKRWE